MYDFICIGNISIDLYFKGESLTYKDNRFQLAIGGKYFADEFYEDIGGGGCNVAAGLTKHGYKVAVFAKIGNNPFRELILKKLKDKNIQNFFIEIWNLTFDFGGVSFRYVPREENREADRIVNQVLDREGNKLL